MTMTGSEGLLQSIFDHLTSGVIRTDAQLRVTLYNRFAQELFAAASRPVAVSTPLSSLLPDERILPLFEDMRCGKETTPCPRLRTSIPVAQGEHIDLDLTVVPLKDERGSFEGVLCLLEDVTARNRTEYALRQSQRRFEDIANNGLEWVWEMDPSGVFTYVSPIVEKLLGYKPAEMIGKTFWQTLHPKEPSSVTDRLKGIIAARKPFREIETQHLQKNGRSAWCSTSGVPVFAETGALIGYRGSSIDMSERKWALEVLQKSERRYRLISENAHDLIALHNPDEMRYLYVNIATVGIIGYAEPELLGQPLRQFVHPDDQDLVAELGKRCVEQGEGSTELRYLKKGGEVFWGEIRAKMTRDEQNNPVILSISRDVTERHNAEVELARMYNELRQAQDQLIQAQKIAIMGQFSVGIAHEIKNPLAITTQALEALGRRVDQNDAKAKQYLGMIEKATHRASAVITELLHFSRSSQLQVKNLRLHEVIDRSILLIQNRTKLLTIAVTPHYVNEPVEVFGDAILLEEVFLNLFSNAVDAMNEGGEICVRTALQKDQRFSKGVVMIEIADTGSGIPEEYLSHVFEPFFTTRESGKGTGLGLSLVQLILERHRAEISVRSELGKGTTFTIVMPLYDPALVEEEIPAAA